MKAGGAEVARFHCPFCLQAVVATVNAGELEIDHGRPETCEVFRASSEFDYLLLVNRVALVARRFAPAARA